MWRPPQRIEHRATPGRWPDAAEAVEARLFQPIDLGPARLARRTWVPAMVPWRATEEGFVSDAVLDWYRRFAEGRPGAIVVEATGIRDVPSGPLLRIGHDRFLPGLSRLVETVRQASGGETRLFIQIIDFLAIRRRPTREAFFGRHLAITDRLRVALGLSDEAAIRQRLLEMPPGEADALLDERERESLSMGYRERVTDTHLPHIRDLPRDLPDLFAAAAVRAREAGFDGVELHYAHAYTMASFLSARNDRADGYGGPRGNRVRLPLEVYGRVRERVGREFAVGCRFLAEECIDGGGTVEDAEYFATAFARAGMDFLSTSRGGKFDDAAQPRVGEAAYPYTGPSGYECMPQYLSDEAGPFGRNLAATARIRRTVRGEGLRTPIVVTGGIHNFEQAEGILARGEADIVGMARQSLADPDWSRKVLQGRGAEVRLCEYSNYCEGLDQKHKPVTCKLWDRLVGRRRMVAPDWTA